MRKPNNTYSNCAGIKNTDTVVGYNCAQTICLMVSDSKRRIAQVELTSDTKNCAFLEFCRDSVLDLTIGLVVHGCCIEHEVLRHVRTA